MVSLQDEVIPFFVHNDFTHHTSSVKSSFLQLRPWDRDESFLTVDCLNKFALMRTCNAPGYRVLHAKRYATLLASALMCVQGVHDGWSEP